jgi:methylated-DNA-[protein]-cysteine S-methyltransferase
MSEFFHSYYSPLGWLRIHSDESSLKSIEFLENSAENLYYDFPEIILRTINQLNEYFEGQRREFNLELNPAGSLFQQNVWKMVQRVGFGETKTYRDIAAELGSNKFSRAVGMANGKNPIPIIIPCHRIIGANGKLTGYSGGLERKRWLLVHEQTDVLIK